MLNRDGVRKYSFNSRKQILANVEFQESIGCIVPQSMGVDVTGNGRTIKLAKAGTPIHVDLTNINNKSVTPAAAVSESATADIGESTGITAASVVAATFGTKIGGKSGTYEFEASVEDTTVTWTYDDETVTLNEYGISVTGTAVDGDTVTIEYVAADTAKPMNAVLLHDVDVTDGDANGTALLFGFVNTNRLDDDVKTAIASALQVTGATQLITFMAV